MGNELDIIEDDAAGGFARAAIVSRANSRCALDNIPITITDAKVIEKERT